MVHDCAHAPGRDIYNGPIAMVVYVILAILNLMCLKAVERKTNKTRMKRKKTRHLDSQLESISEKTKLR